MNHNDKQTVIFTHIPKTAGSTISTIIRRQYDKASIHVSRTKRIPRLPPLESSRGRIADLKAMSDEQRAKIDVFTGHEGFGVHELLPRQCTYITVMRDPVDRIISHYYYVLRRPKHRLYDEITTKKMSLKDYAASGLSTELDNSQTKYLAGLETPYLKYGEYSDDILGAAVENIQKHFSVVGLQERFDETMLLLEKALGWKRPLYVKANVTDTRPRKEDLSADTLSTIEKYNELDIELYRLAQERFEKQIEAFGKDMSRQVKLFSLQNKAYGVYCSSRSVLRYPIKQAGRLYRNVFAK